MDIRHSCQLEPKKVLAAAAEGKNLHLAVQKDGTKRPDTTIGLYLTEIFFPDAGMGVPSGDPLRRAYLSWLAYYGNVMEPVFVAAIAKMESPAYHATFRGMAEIVSALSAAFREGPFLMGQRYSAIDLLISGMFAWAP